MAGKVLLAYASKYGATAEIAGKIEETLKQEGIEVDMVPVKRVKKPADYQDIILGTAIYMGFWRREMVNFLKKNEKLIGARRVWLFATGPSGQGDPVQLLKGVTIPPTTKKLADRLKLKEIKIFGGYLNEQKMNFFEKWIVKRVGGGFGDFRDWEMINAWAKEVAGALKA